MTPGNIYAMSEDQLFEEELRARRHMNEVRRLIRKKLRERQAQKPGFTKVDKP